MSSASELQTLSLADFDYTLPSELIAQYPLDKRDQSRMLVLDRAQQQIHHAKFSDFVSYCSPGDLVVFNNAKVIPARLQGCRMGHTGKVELFLLHPENTAQTIWQVLMKPSRKLPPGTTVTFDPSPLTATILDRFENGKGRVQLDWPQTQYSIEAILAETGQLPIPPYLARDTEVLDYERYQTVFAKVPGAQAAPTAGLHFTPEMIERIREKGVATAEVTLNVSAGTFRPVLSDTLADHRMDPEFYTISDETARLIEATRTAGHKIIAIGTTVAKTLETAALNHQGQIQAESQWSEVFITPGFRFQVVDALLTNFHLPKSTLLMLVSAFASRELIQTAYQEAIAERYRFYSYGDCMLIG